MSSHSSDHPRRRSRSSRRTPPELTGSNRAGEKRAGNQRTGGARTDGDTTESTVANEAHGPSGLLNVGPGGLQVPPAREPAELPLFLGLDTALPTGRRARSRQRLRVCIVTREFFGPFKNGGIGTAYTHLAHFLSKLGHSVTVYFVAPPRTDPEEIAKWVAYYEGFGITFLAGTEPDPPSSGSPNSRAMHFTRQVYEWLKPREFDVVHVSEYRGDGYISLQAKKLGLAFADTTFVVKTSSPTLWCSLGNDSALTDVSHTITMYLERKSVELADYVISPSQHMLRWMTDFGYELPASAFVQPNLIVPATDAPLSAFPPRTEAHGTKRAVNEIVFFGRLEWRKGLVIFCRALRVLQRNGDLDGISVTLMGKGTKETLAYVAGESELWRFDWQLIDDYDSQEAIEYLKGTGRVACIPSLVENSAFTIYESLLHDIPFVASDTGGNAELVHPADRAAVIFPKENPSALVRTLSGVIRDGVTVARPSFGFARSRKVWKEFHDHLAAEGERRKAARPQLAVPSAELPTVTICMAHYNRPVELGQALDSIRALTYPHVELIITDDGSAEPDALEYLESLKPEFDQRGWQILYQENRYLGAARNNSARHASGRYLLFMDDDNLAKPEELDVFVDVAMRTDADILTCFADDFSGDDPHAPGAKIKRELAVGDCLASGIVKNVFGDANALIKREVFEQLGGFTEDFGTGTQDYELFLTAVLKGYRLEVVPEALFWYRSGHDRMNSSFDTMERGRLRAFRTVFDEVPRPLHLTLRLAQGSAMELMRLRIKYNRLLGQMRRIQQDYALLQSLVDHEPAAGRHQPAAPAATAPMELASSAGR